MFETTLDHRVKIRVCSLCSPRIESFFSLYMPGPDTERIGRNASVRVRIRVRVRVSVINSNSPLNYLHFYPKEIGLA